MRLRLTLCASVIPVLALAEALAALGAVEVAVTIDVVLVLALANGVLLARSPATFPIPGFKNEAQVRDNLGALEKGPIPPDVMAEIDAMLERQMEPT